MTAKLPVAIDGRPDFADRDFGKTYPKRFPPYVYSLLGGMLVHRVRSVEAQWYTPTSSPTHGFGGALARLSNPALTIKTYCGQAFYSGAGRRAKRSRACEIPRADAVLCGRCLGTGPVFGRGLAEKSVSRSFARAHVGCVSMVGQP